MRFSSEPDGLRYFFSSSVWSLIRVCVLFWSVSLGLLPGFPRSFAFVTLSSTAPQIARLLSLLNGATWKSCVLRIGEARPTWDLRLEKEREAVKRAAEDGEADGKKKKMKLGKGVKGTEAKQMDPIDLESAADKKVCLHLVWFGGRSSELSTDALVSRSCSTGT